MTTSFQRRLTHEPYSLFFLTGIVLFILSFFMWGQSLDLHIHDTYFVIAANYFIWTIALIFFLAWGLYKLTDRILWTKKLIWLHVLTTLFVFIILATFDVWHDEILPPIRGEAVSVANIFEDQKKEKLIALIIAIMFIVGQLSYIVNLIGGIFRRRP